MTVSAALPVSRQQRALWRAAEALDGTPFLNLTRALNLRGGLDPERLAAAFDALVRSQEMLRVGFVGASGEPEMRRAERPRLALLDVGSAQDPEHAAAEAVVELRDTPFALDGTPLVRAALVRVGPAEHVFVLVAHALAADARSLDLAFAELGARYDGPTEDGGPATQYAQLAAAELANEAKHAADERFWTERLAGLRELPFPPPFDPEAPPRFGQEELALPPGVSDATTAFCAAERVTRFHVLAAGAFSVLREHLGVGDLRLGSMFENRLGREAARLVGPFAQGLVLRVEVDPAASFRELVRLVRTSFLEAVAHQAVTFDALAEAAEREGLPREEFAPASIGVLEPRRWPQLGGLEVRPFWTRDPRQAAVGSILHLYLARDREEGEACGVAYDESRYAREDAQRLVEQLSDRWAAGVSR